MSPRRARPSRSASRRDVIAAVDVGNSNITIGIFSGDRLACSARAITRRRTTDEWEVLLQTLLSSRKISLSAVTGSAVASVVPDVTDNIRRALLRHHSFVLDLNDPVVRAFVRVDYIPPVSVGADRIANAAAAHRLYPRKKNKIVVDFGTATTFDCVAADGGYLGGVIYPGVEISAQSLFEKTAQLPKIDFSPVRSAIGKDTRSSIRSGLFYGSVGAVREILKEIEKELGPSIRIGTGGLAPVVCPAVGGFHAIDADLTLKGVKMLFDKFRASR